MIAKIMAAVVLIALVVVGVFVGIPYATYTAQPDRHIDAEIIVTQASTGATAVSLNASLVDGRISFNTYLGQYWSSPPDPNVPGNFMVEYTIQEQGRNGSMIFNQARVYSDLSHVHFGFSADVPMDGFFIVTATLFAKSNSGLIDAPLNQVQVVLVGH